MSKMRMPEMSVVRFTESDVIVASSDRFTLNKFGDGSRDNAYVYYNGRNYGLGQSGAGSYPQNLFDAFNDNNPGVGLGYGSPFHWQGSSGSWSDATFSEIMGFDATDTENSVDGTYYWSGSQFIKQ